MSRVAADDPSHRRIMPKPLGVIDILVSGKPPEHRLPQHSDQSVAAVLARPRVAGQIRKAERDHTEGCGLVALSDASPQTPSPASRQSLARHHQGSIVDP